MPFPLSQPPRVMIGVIIPSHNRPDLLADAMASLQNQTHGDWVAVIVDDASSVDYAPVRAQFEADSRFNFIRRDSNGGVNQACNAGLDWLAARGDVDYIAIMDDDDTLAADYFAAAASQILEHPQYGWFMSNNFGDQKASSRRIRAEMELDYIDDYIYGKFRGDKGRLIHASLLRELRFDARFRSSHRWPFFTNIAQHTKIWAFPHDSVRKRYLEGGITHSSRGRTSLSDIRHNIYKHWNVIRHRPRKAAAYKYLILESLKAAPRILRLMGRGAKPGG